MSEIGFSIALRVILLVIGVLILLVNSGSLVYFWKKLDIGQRFYVTGTLLLQVFILDELREFIHDAQGWRWRLAALAVGQFCLLIDVIFPLSRRRRAADELLDVLKRERY